MQLEGLKWTKKKARMSRICNKIKIFVPWLLHHGEKPSESGFQMWIDIAWILEGYLICWMMISWAWLDVISANSREQIKRYYRSPLNKKVYFDAICFIFFYLNISAYRNFTGYSRGTCGLEKTLYGLAAILACTIHINKCSHNIEVKTLKKELDFCSESNTT